MFLSLVFITGTEFIDYSPDSERKNPNNQEILQQGAVKWQNLPYQHRKFPKKSEKSLGFCALIEKINLYTFVDIVGYNYEDHHP